VRSYYRRSPLGILVRWTLVFGGLYVALSLVSWVFTELLPELLPATVVGALAAAASWLASRARG
jgi:hypothetical protein